jgi:hypothetical protein
MTRLFESLKWDVLCKGIILNVDAQTQKSRSKQLNFFSRAIANGRTVSIHPSSVLFGQKPDCAIYNELVRTSREYMRDLTRIDPLWLPELAPQVSRPGTQFVSREE